MRNSIFAQPYLASNDNRSVAGIDCPVCNMRNKAIPLKTVPINQGVRIFTEHDLKTRTLGNINFSYGDPSNLPRDLLGNVGITFWRCENCDLVFQREFDEWTDKQLQRQIYNAQYVKLLPNVATDLPRYRATFLRNLFSGNIKKLEVLICESGLSSVCDELVNNGINARTYQLFNPDFNPSGLGTFDLVVAFMVLERLPTPEKTLRKILKHCKKDSAILLARYRFNFKDESQHLMLSPRNGFFRMYSQKSLELILEGLGLSYIHVTPEVTLAYRRLPSFAEFLQSSEINTEELMTTREDGEVEGKDNESYESPSEQDDENGIAYPTDVTVRSERVVVRKTLYGTTAYNSRDQLVGASLDNYGEYLRGDWELFQQLVRPNWVVFDIAANIGLHCMMLSPLLNEGGIIHAFEPYEASFQLLGMNIQLNDLDNVRTYSMAIGADSHTTHLAPTDPNKPGSMAAKGWADDYAGPEVAMNSIDSLQPQQCHFIHACVPECEADILAGAEQTLARFKPVVLVNCVNEQGFEAIYRQLKKHDYRMYWHIQPFFQNKNFFGNTENVFDSAGVAKILAFPANKEQSIGLTEITSEEDWIA